MKLYRSHGGWTRVARLTVVPAVGLIGLIGAACSDSDSTATPAASEQGTTAAATAAPAVAEQGSTGTPVAAPTVAQRTPAQRFIYAQATELDSRRTLSQDAFPQATRDAYPQYFGPPAEPATSGGDGGYYLFMSAKEEWRIGSYMFLPGDVIVYQGDAVTMELLGVRGGNHHNVLVGPDGNTVRGTDGKSVEFDVRRGALEVINFTADQAGVYQLICKTHPPTMIMNIHVLP